MKWPKIKDVASDLIIINRGIGYIDPADAEFGCDENLCDVRLQVHKDCGWTIHTGDSSYDQDHRGYWGSSFLPGCNRNGRPKRFDSVDIARDLIEQCKEQFAMEE